MTTGEQPNILNRQLRGAPFGGVSLLAAVREGTASVALYFNGFVDTDNARFPDGTHLSKEDKINGCSVWTISTDQQKAITIAVEGTTRQVAICPSALDLFAEKNVLLGTRNGESATVVADWLKFHHTTQGANAAVILDRTEPTKDPHFFKQIKQKAKQSGIEAIVVLQTDTPLGKPGMPAENHPFCAPKAPGKDRMEIPNPDPWRAPLGASLIYDIIRAGFLKNARAVASIDTCDLLNNTRENVFDHAVNAPTGVIQLQGQMCYPWRIKPESDVHFSDHICTPFDHDNRFRRWCVAPAKTPGNTRWQMTKLRGPDAPSSALLFHRHMSLRHPAEQVSAIVAKSSLTEDPLLLKRAKSYWKAKPSRIPKIALSDQGKSGRTIVTTMKNEGPFILEWLAYHRAIGFDNILVYTNDCTDGTDTMLKMLQDKGICQHRENPFKSTNLRPQHAALRAAEDEPVIQNAAWVTCIDVDEFVNIKTGNGTLDALFAAVPDANLISMTWRLFGNGDIHGFEDRFITDQFTRCAPEFCRKPHQAWGFKTLFQNNGIFKKLGVHRPKGLNPQLWEDIHWSNGSGQQMPRGMYRNGWRSTAKTYGYDLVQLNHYAVRSAESFLVKRDRGRVNHVDRDQGLSYWFRMNNNAETETSIQQRSHLLQAEWDRLMSDPEIAAAHVHSVAKHREKIQALKATDNYAKFYAELTGQRLQKLSRLHSHFGANVFLSGPDVIPDTIVDRSPGDNFTFTVAASETTH